MSKRSGFVRVVLVRMVYAAYPSLSERENCGLAPPSGSHRDTPLRGMGSCYYWVTPPTRVEDDLDRGHPGSSAPVRVQKPAHWRYVRRLAAIGSHEAWEMDIFPTHLTRLTVYVSV